MNAIERREHVYALREQGLTFREIGLWLGFTVERARRLCLRGEYERYLAEHHPFASRISNRSRNGLVRYFGDERIIFNPPMVAKLGKKRLSKIRSLGRKSIEEISKALHDLGYIANTDLW